MITFDEKLCVCKLGNIEPGVDSNRLLDDKTILDELADVLARVGVGDLVNLIGVQPDLKKRSWDWECEIDNNSPKGVHLSDLAPCSCHIS